MELFLFLSILFTSCHSFVVQTAIGAGIGTLAAFSGKKVYCRFKECCTDRWTNRLNITGLQAAMRHRVFGQHLVTDTVYKAVKGHLLNKTPSKALALSFNGWTGSGKNFVSKIIAEHIFAKGMESAFVHQIIATHDFPHASEIESYKDSLKKWIVGNVTNCERSLFIFDEMDKMPEGLVDVLKPFLDYHGEVGGINYRKSVYLFLSNTGGNLINEEVLKNWKLGKKRESITIKQMDRVINLGAFNAKGGFWHAALIQANLIDYFVPFMPLQRSHIKQCAKIDMEQKGFPVTDSALNKVADELLYFPDDVEVFSKSGCKKVSSKVDFIMG